MANTGHTPTGHQPGGHLPDGHQPVTSGGGVAFPGTVSGDGGFMWPARSNDPRWAQVITDSGIAPSGNFIDNVHQALEVLTASSGAMDDLWKRFKAANGVTDTSEPFVY